jgi:hypothetical protein
VFVVVDCRCDPAHPTAHITLLPAGVARAGAAVDRGVPSTRAPHGGEMHAIV